MPISTMYISSTRYAKNGKACILGRSMVEHFEAGTKETNYQVTSSNSQQILQPNFKALLGVPQVGHSQDQPCFVGIHRPNAGAVHGAADT